MSACALWQPNGFQSFLHYPSPRRAFIHPRLPPPCLCIPTAEFHSFCYGENLGLSSPILKLLFYYGSKGFCFVSSVRLIFTVTSFIFPALIYHIDGNLLKLFSRNYVPYVGTVIRYQVEQRDARSTRCNLQAGSHFLLPKGYLQESNERNTIKHNFHFLACMARHEMVQKHLFFFIGTHVNFRKRTAKLDSTWPFKFGSRR